MEAKKDQLLHRYFEAVNDLYPPWRGEDILVKVARVVDLKSKITNWIPVGNCWIPTMVMWLKF